jgi:ubiquinone/menaquinone biosynthesis C-methylase UbiE
MWTLPTDKTWKYYGEKAPYYGIFGQDMYLNDNLNDQVKNEIFSSGYAHVEDLFETIHSKLDSSFIAEKILDFGCGPGRFIIPFSKYANEVVGIDISQHMLDEARRNCLKYNVTNATFFLSDDNLQCIRDREFDLVNSFIVLQHLHIKRGEKLINLLIRSIKANGVGVLHVTGGL